MKEARLYNKGANSTVDCFLCRHRCHIEDGKRGICNVRKNEGGTLFSIFYAKPIAVAVDPIEKKPLYHFLPGTESFSIATVGCNFQCPFCQNWDISQYGRTDQRPKTEDQRQETEDQRQKTPEEIALNAKEYNCKTIAYTYSEPTIFFEYAYDIAITAAKYDIRNVFVTNGFMTREMLDAFHPNLHAANVDLKAFNPKTYKTMMEADLQGVLDTIKYMKELGIWVEVTTLIVTGMNDSAEELKGIAEFIASVGREIPWHISRFHPTYKVTDRSPTPTHTLDLAYEIGKKAGLRYVYVGNVAAGDKENTFCYNCGEKLIERTGFYIKNINMDDSKCHKCGSKIDGIFK